LRHPTQARRRSVLQGSPDRNPTRRGEPCALMHASNMQHHKVFRLAVVNTCDNAHQGNGLADPNTRSCSAFHRISLYSNTFRLFVGVAMATLAAGTSGPGDKTQNANDSRPQFAGCLEVSRHGERADHPMPKSLLPQRNTTAISQRHRRYRRNAIARIMESNRD
jgi:hypothetical protein